MSKPTSTTSAPETYSKSDEIFWNGLIALVLGVVILFAAGSAAPALLWEASRVVCPKGTATSFIEQQTSMVQTTGSPKESTSNTMWCIDDEGYGVPRSTTKAWFFLLPFALVASSLSVAIYRRATRKRNATPPSNPSNAPSETPNEAPKGRSPW